MYQITIGCMTPSIMFLTTSIFTLLKIKEELETLMI